MTLASPHTTSLGVDERSVRDGSGQRSDPARGTPSELVDVLRETARRTTLREESGPGTPTSLVSGARTTERSDSAESVQRTTALDQALAALKEVAVGSADEARWMRAARLLRQAALERKYGSPRVASAALVVSDALTFTEVQHVDEGGREPLRVALRVLTQPFVSTEDEAAMFQAFLTGGWYVTAAFDPERFAQ
jgi:hypothetical protein